MTAYCAGGKPIRSGDALGRCFDCMWNGKSQCPGVKAMKVAEVPGVTGTTRADQLLRELVDAHAEWDALHWSQRNQPSAADKLLEARRKACDYVASLGVKEDQRG